MGSGEPLKVTTHCRSTALRIMTTAAILDSGSAKWTEGTGRGFEKARGKEGGREGEGELQYKRRSSKRKTTKRNI